MKMRSPLFRAAHLFGAKFLSCTLIDPQFEAADLSAADFSGTLIIGGDWKNALFNRGTNLPFSVEKALSLGMKQVSEKSP